MGRFVAKHLLFLLLTLLVVSFLVFTLNEFSPGAVARKVLGAYATQEQVDLLTTQMGLDRPLLVRYVDYVRAVLSGDLGQSARFKAPVRDVIARHLANTAFLAAIAFACIVPLSMILGVMAGMREGSRLGRVILKHALRNAMLTPITVIMLQINYLVAGVVVVETVFAYPGFGRMMLEATLFKDIALVEAGALVAVFLAVVTNILGDLAYVLLDPRIRA